MQAILASEMPHAVQDAGVTTKRNKSGSYCLLEAADLGATSIQHPRRDALGCITQLSQYFPSSGRDTHRREALLVSVLDGRRGKTVGEERRIWPGQTTSCAL